MWLAKPLSALSSDEILAWARIEKPLSQTLSWGQAAESVSGPAYLVFSPDEGVGGLLLSSSDPRGGVRFECINGPLLDWDDATKAPRQLATFAAAVARLDRAFRSMSLRPRWRTEEAAARLKLLPIEAHSSSQAATIQIPLLGDLEAQRQKLSPRLRRTLGATARAEATQEWTETTPSHLESFVHSMQEFGAGHGFSVPPLGWFRALTSNPELATQERLSFGLGLVRVVETEHAQDGRNRAAARSLILIATLADRAFYLFGMEERSPDTRSALSPSAQLQWAAIERLTAQKIRNYDLNGYVENEDHPYSGVSRFKEQFGGQIVRYEVPEFLIES